MNPRQLGRLHLAWSARKDKTVWNAVNQVKPGTFLEIDLDRPCSSVPHESTYWNWSKFLAEQNKDEKPLCPLDEDYFRYKFSKAVERQSMSDVGIGCYLSGGIDSSVIAYELSQQKSLKYLLDNV